MNLKNLLWISVICSISSVFFTYTQEEAVCDKQAKRVHFFEQLTLDNAISNDTTLQRFYHFVSKNKGNIVLGVVSTLGLSFCMYSLYDLFYISGPANKKAMADSQELIRQTKVLIELLKKV